ncbi:MAG: DPP IV N-terminal domain-containing protein, partial [Pyrinomonadaceae bacterium]
ARQLTSRTRSNNQPSVTADGRYIVFRSVRTGTWNIWRMDLDGGNVKQLTEGGNDNWPRPSPDGRWVVFSSSRAGAQSLWKVSIDGGEPVRLTEKNTVNATVSPDGKLIACHYREEANVPYRVALIPFEGGDPVKLLDFSQKFAGPPGLRWTQDGRALIYAETQGGVSNIWSLPVDGGAPKQLTSFKSDEIFQFDFSRDGKQLAASRGQITNDVVLISDFR